MEAFVSDASKSSSYWDFRIVVMSQYLHHYVLVGLRS